MNLGICFHRLDSPTSSVCHRDTCWFGVVRTTYYVARGMMGLWFGDAIVAFRLIS